MTLNLKELIVLKEKLKNTYAYQNSGMLKRKERGKFLVECTENDLVYILVEFLEEKIENRANKGNKLNDKVTILIEDGFIPDPDIPELTDTDIEIKMPKL